MTITPARLRHRGRHSRDAGFITDIEKYNEATFSGWRVFRLADVHLTLEAVGRIKEWTMLPSTPQVSCLIKEPQFLQQIDPRKPVYSKPAEP